MTLGERLQAFIEAEGMSNLGFERICGFCNGYVKGIKDVIGSDKLMQILNKFPNLSPSWLLMEVGPMLINNNDEIVKSNSQFGKTSNFQSGFNQQFHVDSSAEISNLISILKDQMKQNERLIAMLEHIVFQGNIQPNVK